MVDNKHRNFIAHINQASIMRDAIGGDDLIKAKTTKYVPLLGGQSPTEYKAMLNRAIYQNYVSRTLDGITGLVFAKKYQLECSSRLLPLTENIDLDNSTLEDIAQTVMAEVTTVGRCGILVDYPSIDTTGMSQAEVERLNARPYIKVYKHESIINWKTELINNVPQLSMLVLYEVYDEWTDEFTAESKIRYRVYSLVDGVCTLRLFQEDKDGNLISNEPTILMMNGKNLTLIPFFSVTPDNLTIEPSKSPLYDLAKVNLGYFALDVDLCHALHFCAPTPYVSGVHLEQDKTINLGSTMCHVFPDPQATMNFLEFSGVGLTPVSDKLREMKESMLVLGTRLLQSESNVQIAEGTMAMKSAGDRSVISSIADTVSRGLEMALNIMAQWMNDNTPVVFKLNRDYSLNRLDAQSMKELIAGWQMGALSQRDLFINLQKGEIIAEDVTFEDYQGEIELQAPQLSVPPKV